MEKISCKNSEFELLLTMEETGLHWPCFWRWEQMPLWAGGQALFCRLNPHLQGDHSHSLLAFQALAFVVPESFSDVPPSSTLPIIYADVNVTVIVNSQYLF